MDRVTKTVTASSDLDTKNKVPQDSASLHGSKSATTCRHRHRKKASRHKNRQPPQRQLQHTSVGQIRATLLAIVVLTFNCLASLGSSFSCDPQDFFTGFNGLDGLEMSITAQDAHMDGLVWIGGAANQVQLLDPFQSDNTGIWWAVFADSSQATSPTTAEVVTKITVGTTTHIPSKVEGLKISAHTSTTGWISMSNVDDSGDLQLHLGHIIDNKIVKVWTFISPECSLDRLMMHGSNTSGATENMWVAPGSCNNNIRLLKFSGLDAASLAVKGWRLTGDNEGLNLRTTMVTDYHTNVFTGDSTNIFIIAEGMDGIDRVIQVYDWKAGVDPNLLKVHRLTLGSSFETAAGSRQYKPFAAFIAKDTVELYSNNLDGSNNFMVFIHKLKDKKLDKVDVWHWTKYETTTATDQLTLLSVQTYSGSDYSIVLVNRVRSGVSQYLMFQPEPAAGKVHNEHLINQVNFPDNTALNIFADLSSIFFIPNGPTAPLLTRGSKNGSEFLMWMHKDSCYKHKHVAVNASEVFALKKQTKLPSDQLADIDLATITVSDDVASQLVSEATIDSFSPTWQTDYMVTNPCGVEVVYTLADELYHLGSGEVIYEAPAPTFLHDSSCTTSPGGTFDIFLDQVLEVSTGDVITDTVAKHLDPNKVSVDTSDCARVGHHTVTYHGAFNNDPYLDTADSFYATKKTADYEVDAEVSTVPSTNYDTTYEVCDADVVILPAFTDPDGCGYKIELVSAIHSVTSQDWNGDAKMTVVSSPFSISIGTDDGTDVGDLAITVKATDLTGAVDYASFTFTVQIQSACGAGIMSTPADAALDQTYMLDDPDQTISLGPITNSDCDFTVTGSDATSPWSAITPPTFAADGFTVTSEASIVFQASQLDLTDLGDALTKSYVQTITVTSPRCSKVETFSFTVTVEHPCKATKGLTKPAAANPYNMDFTLNSGTQTIQLADIGNGGCSFSLVLEDVQENSSFPFSGMRTFFPPQLSQDPTTYLYTVTNGYIEFDTSAVEVFFYYRFKVVINSDQTTSDVDTDSIDVQVRFITTCTKDPQVPSRTDLDYMYQTGAAPHQIPTVVSNGNCDFEVDLIMRDGTSVDPDVFTFVKSTFVTGTITDGHLEVSTSDLAKEKTWEFRLILRSKSHANDVLTKQVDFDVVIGCEPTIQLPEVPLITVYSASAEKLVMHFADFYPEALCPGNFDYQVLLGDGDLADPDVFTFIDHGSTHAGSILEIYTQDIEKTGLYDLLLVGTSDIFGIEMIDFAVSITDECYSAEVTVPFPTEDYEFEAGISELKVKWKPFEVDKEGEQCAEMKYIVTTFSEGSEILEQWISINADADTRSITFKVPEGEYEDPTIVYFSVTGTAGKGMEGMPQATDNFEIYVTSPPPALEEAIIPLNDTNTTEPEVASVEYSMNSFNILDIYSWVPPTPKPKKKGARPKKPPSAYITDITAVGNVTLNFTRALMIPPLYKNLTNELLADVYNETIHQFIEVFVDDQGEDDDDGTDKTIVRFNLTSFHKWGMTLDVVFEKPDAITTDIRDPDLLGIRFMKHSYFVDRQTYLTMEKDHKISYEIPPQLTFDESQTLVALESATSAGMTALASTNILLNILFSFALKYVWNLINLLQFLIYIIDWQITTPILPKASIKTLRFIVYMEFIPHETITDKISELLGFASEDSGDPEEDDEDYIEESESVDSEATSEDAALADEDDAAQAEEVDSGKKRRRLDVEVEAVEEGEGDESTVGKIGNLDKKDIVKGMGMMLLVFLLIIICIAVLMSFQCVIYYKYSWFLLYMKLKRKIFWNAFIRYTFQSMLKMQMAFGWAIFLANWNSMEKVDVAQVSIAILGETICLLMPVMFGYILYRNFKDLYKPSVKDMMGSMYLGIKDDQVAPLCYSAVFLLRRTLFVALTFGLYDYPGIQCHLFIVVTLMQIAYLCYAEPHEQRLTGVCEVINEVIFLLVLYHFVLFAKLVHEPNMKKYIGISCISFVGLLLLFNMLVIGSVTIQGMRRDYHLNSLKKAQKKKIEDMLRKYKETAQQSQENPSLLFDVEQSEQKPNLRRLEDSSKILGNRDINRSRQRKSHQRSQTGIAKGSNPVREELKTIKEESEEPSSYSQRQSDSSIRASDSSIRASDSSLNQSESQIVPQQQHYKSAQRKHDDSMFEEIKQSPSPYRAKLQSQVVVQKSFFYQDPQSPLPPALTANSNGLGQTQSRVMEYNNERPRIFLPDPSVKPNPNSYHNQMLRKREQAQQKAKGLGPQDGLIKQKTKHLIPVKKMFKDSPPGSMPKPTSKTKIQYLKSPTSTTKVNAKQRDEKQSNTRFFKLMNSLRDYQSKMDENSRKLALSKSKGLE